MISIQNIFETSAEQPKKQAIIVLTTNSNTATSTVANVRLEINIKDEVMQQSTLMTQSDQRLNGWTSHVTASVIRNAPKQISIRSAGVSAKTNATNGALRRGSGVCSGAGRFILLRSPKTPSNTGRSCRACRPGE